MIERTKNFFSSSFKFFFSRLNQKGFIIPIPFIIGASLLALPLLGTKSNLANDISLAIYSVIFSAIGSITTMFASLAAHILQWVISPEFTTLSYTNPAGNPIIEAGLGITQNLVNMILVLILIYIAVATILRLAGHSTQKLLITFIAVALLVNFAPVIVGLIVDAANIVMNFFLKDLFAFTNLSEKMGEMWKGTALAFKGINEGGNKPEAAFFRSLTTAVFAFFLGLAFFLFAMVFVMRRIAIWILVILAPLAFACYILPATKKYWTMWWNQLVQWSIMGVAAAFFLNLGTILIVETPKYIKAPTGGDLTGDMSALMLAIVPLVFLYAGLTVGFRTSAIGAGAVNSLITKGKGKFQTWAKTGGKKTWGWAKTSAREAVPQRLKGAIAKWETMPMLKQPGQMGRFVAEKVQGQGKGKFRGTAGKVLGGLTTGAAGAGIGALWALRRGAGQLVGTKALESEKKEISGAEENVKGKPAESVITKFRNPLATTAQRIGYLNRLVKEDDLDEALDKGLTNEEISKTYVQAKKYDAHKDILAAYPQIAQEEIKLSAAQKAFAGGPVQSLADAYSEQIIGKIRPDRAAHLSRRVYAREATGQTHAATGTRMFSNPEVIESMIKSWDANHVSNFVKMHGRAGAEAIEDRIKQLAFDAGLAQKEWLGKFNPRLLKYMRTGAGRHFFTI